MENNKAKLIMKSINKASNLFFDRINMSNSSKRFRIKNRYYKIKCYEKLFTSKSLLHIGVNFKKIIRTYRFSNITVELDLLEVENFADKNTYLILDLFIFHLLYNCPNIEFRFSINITWKNIIHNGFNSTALYRVSMESEHNIIEQKRFIETYIKSFIGLQHFRKIYTGEDLNDMLASNLSTNIDMTMKPYFDEEWRDEVAEAVSEIVCNACSHNKDILIVDIDICDQVLSNQGDSCNYKALNISILNIGDNLIYERIMDNVKKKKYKEDDKVYKNVYIAYNNHKNFFEDDYNENDFFTITAFQKRVSSRFLESGQSGTGLTRLLQNITGKTEDNISYVLSGNNGISFKNELLNVSIEGTVGFNSKNDYVRDRPDKQVVLRCPIFIPGTIYQLHLVRRDLNE